ncbi:MAG: DUF4056 domain-containing protein [Planctomycetota bacterium]|jgi:hypothetical protein
MERDEFARCVLVRVLVCVVVPAVFLFGGCRSGTEPRLRIGAFFGSPTGMSFPEPNHLGNHNFAMGIGEKNGMVYTCKAGFIDIGHVREAADRTRYLVGLTYQNLMRGKTEFSFTVIEPSRYLVKLEYPQSWADLATEQKADIAKETSITLGQYFAHTSMIWHEILTWYGFSSLGIFPENISSFSCEDSYSDVLGTDLAVRALRENELPFDDAITELIYEQLEALDVQPAGVARRTAKQIQGKWFTGGLYFMVKIKKRNFDVGFDDGRVTPILVPGVCADTEPKLWPVPNIDSIGRDGFKMTLEIEPRTIQQGSIYHAIDLDRTAGHIQPRVHFPEIIKLIRHQKK